MENNSIVAAELVPHQEASKVSQDSKQTPDDSRNSRKRQSSQDDVHDKALKDTRRTHAENRESYTLTEKSSQKALVSTTTTTTSSTITTQNGSAKEPKPSHSPNERNGPNYDRRNGSDGEHQDTTPTTKSDPRTHSSHPSKTFLFKYSLLKHSIFSFFFFIFFQKIALLLPLRIPQYQYLNQLTR